MPLSAGVALFQCIAERDRVPGVQGREKDIVIFSAVRSVRSKAGRARIGFVADERRLNVGLTRARASLLVVGNFRALQSDPNWRALAQHAKQTGCAVPCRWLLLPTPAHDALPWCCSAVPGAVYVHKACLCGLNTQQEVPAIRPCASIACRCFYKVVPPIASYLGRVVAGELGPDANKASHYHD